MILSKAAAPALVLLFVATACSSTDTQVDAGSHAEVLSIERTLDFDAPPHQGELLLEIPYGSRADEVGFVPACAVKCAPPCPCTAPTQPSAFDVDDTGNVWILDNAKERVVLFDTFANLLRESERSGRPLAVAEDLQRVKGEAVVLTQNEEFEARLLEIVPSAPARDSPLIFQGAPAEAHRLWTDGDTISTIVDIDQGGSYREVPGLPFPGGWFLFQGYRGPRAISFGVSSPEQNWRLNLQLTLTQTVDGETKSRSGNVSWEPEIGPDGTMHLLLFAGTEGRHATDGYWYLRVAPDGTVGRPVHLKGPTRRDDQQSRRLTLDAAGRPFAMWAERDGVRIESLAALQP